MKKFTKDMLCDGDIVEYRTGCIRTVKNNALYGENGYQQSTIDIYDEDLKCQDSNPLDIVKVYRQIWKREEPTITSDEKNILRSIDSKFKYIARDYGGDLYIYYEEPEKNEEDWITLNFVGCLNVFGHLFRMVKFEDEEPWLIEDLLKLPVKEDK